MAVRCPERRREWAELFAGAVVGGKRLCSDQYCDLALYSRTDRRIPRWQWWAEKLQTTARLPPAKPLPADAVAWARPLAGRVALAPFAAHANRSWPVSRWLDVERDLVARGLRCIVLDSGPKERTEQFQSEKLIGEAPARVAAVIQCAAAFAGNDSGLAHVAGFLRTPAVAVSSHASDNRIMGLYPTVRELGGRYVGMESVQPADVVAAILDQIGRFRLYHSELAPTTEYAPSDMLILSAATPDYDVGVLSQSNHALFAHLTGHRQEFRSEGFDAERPPAWSKIKFLIDVLRGPDPPRWVFWIDADAVFVRAASLLEFTETDRDLVIACDKNGINSGVFLARACQWTLAFFERIWAMGDDPKFRDHAWWEQSAIQHLHATERETRAHIEIVPHQRFNANPSSGGDVDLVAHFYGGEHDAKAGWVAKYVDQLTPGSWQIDERHRDWIRKTLLSGRFRRVLEIGSFRGYSTTAFLDAAKAGAVDEVHLCDTMITPQLEEVIARYDLGNRITIHRRRSVELLAEDARFDLVFVDGDHRVPNVAEEIRLLLAADVRAIFAHDTAHLEGPQQIEPAFAAAGYRCRQDAVERPGEATHRGMLFAAKSEDDFAVGFSGRTCGLADKLSY